MEKKTDAVAVAALVFSILPWCCCNPLSLCLIAAIVLGIITLVTGARPKWMGVVALCSSAVLVILEIVTAIFTMGTSLLL